MSIRRSATLGTCASLTLASVVFSGPAAAQEPEASTVDLIGCALFEGGTTTVDAGLVDVFVTGWGTGSRGMLKQFLRSQVTTFTVQIDDEDPATQDVSDAWSVPYSFESGPHATGWGSDLFVSLGELEAGQVVTVSFETTLTKPVVDFFKGDPPIRPNHLRAGSLGSEACEVTVT